MSALVVAIAVYYAIGLGWAGSIWADLIRNPDDVRKAFRRELYVGTGRQHASLGRMLAIIAVLFGLLWPLPAVAAVYVLIDRRES